MNPAQKIQLERVRTGSFNDFDGETVAEELEKHQKTYIGFLFGRFGGHGDLIELRDIHTGYINASTLMVLTTKRKLPSFKKLFNRWKPDEVGYNYWKRKTKAQYCHGEFVAEGTAPFAEMSEMFTALGSSLQPEQVLVRLWWD